MPVEVEPARRRRGAVYSIASAAASVDLVGRRRPGRGRGRPRGGKRHVTRPRRSPAGREVRVVERVERRPTSRRRARPDPDDRAEEADVLDGPAQPVVRRRPRRSVQVIISGRSATVTRSRRREPWSSAAPSGSPGPASDSRPSPASTTVAVDQVERPDERRHERRRREVVDLDRRADLLDPALAHDDDAIRQRERLLLVVGDVDRRDARAGAGSPGSPCAARPGSWRRAPRAARRAAGPAARSRAPGPARRAAAGRPTAGTGSGRAFSGMLIELEQLADALLDRRPSAAS